MTDHSRIFAVASDEALVDLIASARIRLVVIAPALTKPVADALSRRLDDLGQLSVTVILDADPEVYRLGFGDEQALDAIRAACAKTFSAFVSNPASEIGCRNVRRDDDGLFARFQKYRGRLDDDREAQCHHSDERRGRSHRIGGWCRHRRNRNET